MNRLNRIAVSSTFAVVASGAALLIAGSLWAQPNPPQAAAQKLSATAIQVLRTDPPKDLLIPEDFRVSTYENVIVQLEKTKKFKNVYRDGDRRAADVTDLITLRLVPSAYTAGSQKKREVTTIKGATSISFTVTFVDRSGKVLLEKELEGKVRFYGENLRATYDLAKKVAQTVNDNF